MHTPRLMPRRWFGSQNMPVRATSDYTPVAQLHNEIDKLFDGMLSGFPWTGFGLLPRAEREEAAALLPRLDVTSNEQQYTVTAELPGVKPDAVQVEVREHALVLRGEKKQETTEDKDNYHLSERSYGSFERVLSLPEDAVIDEIKAAHKDGVLTVTIPRKEPEKAQSKTIEISTEEKQVPENPEK